MGRIVDALGGLHVITAPAVGGDVVAQGDARLLATVDAALAAGACVIQLRDKTLDARALVALARVLVDRCHARGALLIVNDRLDVALAAGADGVHLGVDDLPWADARRIAPPPFVIGVSVDSAAVAHGALAAGADYLGVGPAYTTTTKLDAGVPQPFDLYAAIAAIADPRPVVAVGGITAGRAAPLVAAGATTVAVSAAVMHAQDPAAVVRELVSEIAAARASLQR